MNEEIKNNYTGTKISPKPKEAVDIGIDQKNTFLNNIMGTLQSTTRDLSVLESFLNVSDTRESSYQLIDIMAQDSTLSAVLETYSEDTVETNDNGKIVWVETPDPDISSYITYLLDTINVDKHIYCWAYNLIKYGDLYLRMYKKSDYEDDLIFIESNEKNKSKILHEDKLSENVIVKAHSVNDEYVHYLEMVPNPGEMFELTKFGKTMAYIKAPSKLTQSDVNGISSNIYDYRINRNDVEVYQPGDFVHACLEDNSSRVPETVTLYMDTEDGKTRDFKYTVRRGQSLFYSLFKIWRELTLLENSVLLNRVTKSSIVRLIQVEVGDMSKEEITRHLCDIKSMIEQKSAIDTGKSMREYTNPGPVENNIYVPTREGKGSITPQQIGGDVDVKSLADLEYFRDKIFAALRVPKQYFGVTDDAAGFNGGSSLAIISSRYGKAIKRIQNTLLQALTDAINLMLLNKGLDAYVNRFTLRMTTPITQETLDRRDSVSNQVRNVGDIMNELGDVETRSIKLKILKSLISPIVTDPEILEYLQEEIDKAEKEEKESDTQSSPEPEMERNTPDLKVNVKPGDQDEETEPESPGLEFDNLLDTAEEPEEESDYLPTPSELGQDLTNNSEE